MEYTLSQKLHFFSELIGCGQEVYFWEFAPDIQLISTNCPDTDLFRYCIALDGSEEHLRQYVASAGTRPLLLSNQIGLNWIASLELASGMVSRVYLIGPVFTSDTSYQTLEKQLRFTQYPREMITLFLKQLQNLPVILLSSWMQYGLMLHYCVTGEKLDISDYNYQIEESLPQQETMEENIQPVKGGTWLAEQTAMQMIEEGRLDYQKAFNQLSMSSSMLFPAAAPTSIRDEKNYMISFVTLATRAAIRGGLNAETAYFIGNHYMHNVENASSLTELIRLNNTMFADFVKRVHKVRGNHPVSDGIQSCLHYIDLHLSDDLTMKVLAKEAGYSEYYLASKFRKEMGVSVGDYIKTRRIEQAKLLLRSTRENIQEISDSLGFCNPSYFSTVFRSVAGCTPAAYRAGD